MDCFLSADLGGAILGTYIAKADVISAVIGGGSGCWVAAYCYYGIFDLVVDRNLVYREYPTGGYDQYFFETVVYPNAAFLLRAACGALGCWVARLRAIKD